MLRWLFHDGLGAQAPRQRRGTRQHPHKFGAHVRFKSTLPDGVDISYQFDESPTVVTAIRSVATEGLA